MSQLDEFNQNNLLFKRFQGVTQTDIVEPNSYSSEPFKALVNTYNESIFSSDVPTDICSNYSCENLNNGPIGSNNPNVPDVSSSEYGEIPKSLEIIDTCGNLTFYKQVWLEPMTGRPWSWWLIDPSNAVQTPENNLLKDIDTLLI